MGQPLVAKELRTILESLVKALGTAIAVGKTAIKAPCLITSDKRFIAMKMRNWLRYLKNACEFLSRAV